MSEIRVYEDEHVLNNIYLIKRLAHLRNWIISFEINEDMEAMFPDAEVFIE